MSNTDDTLSLRVHIIHQMLHRLHHMQKLFFATFHIDKHKINGRQQMKRSAFYSLLDRIRILNACKLYAYVHVTNVRS